MSAIQFLISGGMANLGGDLPQEQREKANKIIKDFALNVKKSGLAYQIPAVFLNVQQCGFLLVGKDTENFHFVFAMESGTQILYRDFSNEGRLELRSLVHGVRLQIGEPIWAFSCPLNTPEDALKESINNAAIEYINTVLESYRNKSKQVSPEALSMPDIASGLEKFRVDYPFTRGKTAFIIMSFVNTEPHSELVKIIKDTLLKHGIMGLRADDKEYMEDLFHNIKTYMYACDFGIGIYDRIVKNDFNPNVSLEVGYMMGMGKNVLLLKDKNLEGLQTDLAGKLYKQFDPYKISETLPLAIEKWLIDKGYAK